MLHEITKDVERLKSFGEVEIHFGRIIFHTVLEEVNALTGRDDISMRINNCAVFFHGSPPLMCEYRVRKEIG